MLETPMPCGSDRSVLPNANKGIASYRNKRDARGVAAGIESEGVTKESAEWQERRRSWQGWAFLPGAGSVAVEPGEGHLGGVFLCVVEVLAVVPVSRREGLSIDCNGAGPRRTTAWYPSTDGS